VWTSLQYKKSYNIEKKNIWASTSYISDCRNKCINVVLKSFYNLGIWYIPVMYSIINNLDILHEEFLFKKQSFYLSPLESKYHLHDKYIIFPEDLTIDIEFSLIFIIDKRIRIYFFCFFFLWCFFFLEFWKEIWNTFLKSWCICCLYTITGSYLFQEWVCLLKEFLFLISITRLCEFELDISDLFKSIFDDKLYFSDIRASFCLEKEMFYFFEII
jgi:hypothetical protein